MIKIMNKISVAAFLCAAVLGLGSWYSPKYISSYNDNSIYGLWNGNQTDLSNPSIPFNLVINPGGTLIFHSIAAGGVDSFGTGTWSLTDTTLKCTLLTKCGMQAGIGVIQYMQLAYDREKGTLIGTWTNDPSFGENKGSISLEKDKY